jgi:hypothetical protein
MASSLRSRLPPDHLLPAHSIHYPSHPDGRRRAFLAACRFHAASPDNAVRSTGPRFSSPTTVPDVLTILADAATPAATDLAGFMAAAMLGVLILERVWKMVRGDSPLPKEVATKDDLNRVERRVETEYKYTHDAIHEVRTDLGNQAIRIGVLNHIAEQQAALKTVVDGIARSVARLEADTPERRHGERRRPFDGERDYGDETR